jgi:GntR family transcriptional regulator
MWLRVDTRTPRPLFAQIVDGVKAAIARGELEAGAKLPSVRELARTLSVNPNTVVKAYGALEAEGLVVRRQGAGCFVGDATSSLAEGVRAERLERLARQLATEAFHLGFGPAVVREALGRALAELAFPEQPEESAPEGAGEAG